jgi:hypothetical protein
LSEHKKFDGSYLEKPPLDLLPGLALAEVAKVSGGGAVKYAKDNHRLPSPLDEMGRSKEERYLGAALRHLVLGRGERDKESGLSHLAHAAWNVLWLLQFELEKDQPLARLDPSTQAYKFAVGTRHLRKDITVIGTRFKYTHRGNDLYVLAMPAEPVPAGYYRASFDTFSGMENREVEVVA